MKHAHHSHCRNPLPLALALLGLAMLGSTAQVRAAETHHTVVAADAVRWGPAPPMLPPGAQAAVLLGDPSREGPYVLRLKFSPGYLIPPHRHSKDETVTVMSGAVTISPGERVERDASAALGASSFVNLPAGMPHYAWSAGESVVQIDGVGPFDIVYVNPADDPRKQ